MWIGKPSLKTVSGDSDLDWKRTVVSLLSLSDLIFERDMLPFLKKKHVGIFVYVCYRALICDHMLCYSMTRITKYLTKPNPEFEHIVVSNYLKTVIQCKDYRQNKKVNYFRGQIDHLNTSNTFFNCGLFQRRKRQIIVYKSCIFNIIISWSKNNIEHF